MKNIWIVKAAGESGGGWPWHEYFEGGSDGNIERKFDFGDSSWIGSAQSRKYIREQVHKDDLVIAYQTDIRAIVGLTRMASDGYKDQKGIWSVFDLVPAKDAIYLEEYVPIEYLRQMRSDWRPKCLGPGSQGTIFEMSLSDSLSMVEMLIELCPNQAKTIRSWLPQTEPRRPQQNSAIDQKPKPLIIGGGFGNAEINRDVEMAAVEAVTKRLIASGWTVEDVSKENRGYDLVCTSGRQRKHVEVKGTSGDAISFVLTRGELLCSQNDDRFELWLVTNATQSPTVRSWTGKEVNTLFQIEPLQYKVIRRR